MNRRTVVSTRYLTYYKTLICYDGVQLFVGMGPRKRWYVCLATPSGDSGAERFLCTPVSNESFAEYLYERLDLLALIKSSTNGKHYIIDFSEETKKGFPLHELSEVQREWLPDRHIFARCHTEEFYLDQDVWAADLDVSTSEIHIDGRWDARDLSTLSDLFTDNYSFLYSLKTNEYVQDPATRGMFQKFPWRGGFSTVGFYKGLYNQIPRPHRLSIRGIEYHSPGKIEISAADVIVEEIQSTASRFCERRNALQELYRQLYEGMSARELLGRSRDEMDPDPLDLQFVQAAVGDLSNAMGFRMLQQLLAVTNNDWITCAKMFLSYFRRIRALADFFDSGKASFVSEHAGQTA